jgi:hypothetical protein
MNYLPNVGPYTYVSRDEVLEHAGRKFRIVLYGAYNAKGLIGSECNGICILDDDLLNVVLDEHGKEETGYFGPSEQQLEEYERLLVLPTSAFVEFVNSHPRTRQPIELKIRAKRKPRWDAREYIKLATSKLSYKSHAKAEFLRQSEQLCHILAAKMGLNEDQYDVRTNPGGIAVSGDVVLHTDNLYVNLSQSALGPDQGFMYRKCQGRKDFTGGPNRWMKWEQLVDLDSIRNALQEDAGP